MGEKRGIVIITVLRRRRQFYFRQLDEVQVKRVHPGSLQGHWRTRYQKL